MERCAERLLWEKKAWVFRRLRWCECSAGASRFGTQEGSNARQSLETWDIEKVDSMMAGMDFTIGGLYIN
jgi:hypothetical protein